MHYISKVLLLYFILTLPLLGTETIAEVKEGVGTEQEKPYGISVVLDSSLGQGTFITDDYADNPYFAQTFQLLPSYKFMDVNFGLDISATMEYTDTDSATKNNQILFSDLTLSASKSVLKSDFGNLAGSLKFNFPTSLASQATTLYFGMAIGLSYSKIFGPFTLTYALSGKKNFNEYTTNVIKKEDLKDFETYGRKGGNEMLSSEVIALGKNNVSYSIANSLSGAYSFNDSLTLSLSFGYSMAFVYKVQEKDEYTSENAETGRSYRDLISGGIDVSYALNKMFSFSGGISTVQLPKETDTETYRFPWFNFSTPADNLSVFYFDVIVTF